MLPALLDARNNSMAQTCSQLLGSLSISSDGVGHPRLPIVSHMDHSWTLVRRPKVCNNVIHSQQAFAAAVNRDLQMQTAGHRPAAGLSCHDKSAEQVVSHAKPLPLSSGSAAALMIGIAPRSADWPQTLSSTGSATPSGLLLSVLPYSSVSATPAAVTGSVSCELQETQRPEGKPTWMARKAVNALPIESSGKLASQHDVEHLGTACKPVEARVVTIQLLSRGI